MPQAHVWTAENPAELTGSFQFTWGLWTEPEYTLSVEPFHSPAQELILKIYRQVWNGVYL